MKIQNLSEFLKKPFPSPAIYYYFGNRPDIIDLRAQQTLEAYRKHYNSFELIYVSDLSEVEESLTPSLFESPSLFKVFYLTDATDKVLPKLESFIAAFPDNTALIITAPGLNTKAKMTVYADSHKQVTSLACYALSPMDLKNAIGTALETHGLKTDEKTLSHLSDIFESKLDSISASIEKLALYVTPSNEVHLDDCKALFTDEASESVDSLIRAVLQSKTPIIAGICNALWNEHLDPFLIHRTLVSHFMTLFEASALRDSGKTPTDALNGLSRPVFFAIKPLYLEALTKWKSHSLKEALEHLLTLDHQLKINTANSRTYFVEILHKISYLTL